MDILLRPKIKVIVSVLLLPVLVFAEDNFRHMNGPKFIHEPPESVEFSNSTGAVVPCSARGQPEPTIRWEKRDGTAVIGLSGIRQVRPDNSLVFFPVNRQKYRQDVHAAIYRCLATNSVGTIRSKDVHVKAVVQEPYEVHVPDHFVLHGCTAVLQCTTSPFVKPYITVLLWLREDGITIGSPGAIGDKYVILHSGELLIRNVDSSDSQIGYQCQVHHKLTGESKISSTIGKLIIREPHVTMPPTITSCKDSVRSIESTKIILACVAQGFPSPGHRWERKDGTRLTLLHLSDRIQQKDGVLLIKQGVVQDTAIYVCTVNNTMGEDRCETKLFISAPLSASVRPDKQTIDVGKSVSLNCQVTGHPVHSVVWYKDGKPLLTNSQSSFMSRNALQINPVRREDAGMYQCFVTNDLEMAQGNSELYVAEDAPALTSVFPEQAIQPGTSVSLKCSASGNPLPQITWQVDGYPVPEAYHVRIGDYVSDERTVNSYVNISGSSVEDGGTYTCIARNSVNVVAHSKRLNIYGPPFVRPMRNVTALDGHSVFLHCPVSGYPISRIYWKREGRDLPHNHRQKTFANGTLIIEELQRTRDDGIYECVAESNLGRIGKRDLTLNIMAPPIVEPFSFPSDLSEGKRTSAACIVSSGDLPIRISWMKDGHPLPKELRATITMATEFTSILSFTKVSQIHNGNYTCVASNPVAMRNYSAAMMVRVPPKWRTEPTDKSIIMGQSAVFDCQATGFPSPVIRWKKATDGSKSQFQVIISSENVQILENGSLVIKEVSKDDGGQYMCQATNDVGAGLSTVVHLKVHIAAHFEEKFKPITLTVGQSLNLTCNAIGEKPLSLTWSKDRHAFNPDFEPRYTYTERATIDGAAATLRVPSVNRKDSSIFTCTAQNAFGRDTTNFQVVIQEPPDRPTGVEIINKSSRIVSISWPNPYSGNSLITKYVVEHKKTEEPWTAAKVTVVEGSDTTLTLQRLTPSSLYQIRVKADNAVGSGEFSDVVSFTTDGEAPRGPPTDVKAIATGSRTIQVTWSHPSTEENHSPVDGYYVGYKSHSTEQFSYKTMEASVGAKLECEITGLNKISKYEVIVQAFNSKGAGPPSEEVAVHTLEFDPPTIPYLRVSSVTVSSIYLTWQMDEISNPVTGYILFHESGDSEWQEVILSKERNSYTFHGLQCGMSYRFYLVAFNNIGRGQPSEIISSKTNGTLPIAPDKSSLLAINSTFITIHLNSWRSGGCVIKYFVIQYRAQSQAEWILLSNNVLADQRTVTLPDLIPASRYILLMTAHNEAGTTEAEYLFSTLTKTGGTIPPMTSASANEREVFQQLKIVAPIACTTIVLVFIITATCVVLIRKRHPPQEGIPQENDVSKPTDAVPMNVWEKSEQGDTRLSQTGEQIYFPSPYATSRISMYSGDGDPESSHHQRDRHLHQQQSPHHHHHHHQQHQQDNQHHHTWRNEGREHTYDVPFLPRQTIVACLSEGLAERDDIIIGTVEAGFFSERHLYLNPAVVDLPPDAAARDRNLAYISSVTDCNVKSYLYAKPIQRKLSGRSPRTTVIRRNELQRESDGPKYFTSDAETSPSNGESFEFSEAECDMPLRLGMEERPV